MSHCGFNLHVLTAMDSEDLFMFSFAVGISSRAVSVRVFCPFCNCAVCFSTVEFDSSLYIV